MSARATTPVGVARVVERIVDAIAVLQVHGDLIANPWQPSLAGRVRALLEQGERRLVLDLTDVRSVGSAGLGEIVESLALVARARGIVAVAGLTTGLRNLLTITKLLNELDCYETGCLAIESLRASTPPRGQDA